MYKKLVGILFGMLFLSTLVLSSAVAPQAFAAPKLPAATATVTMPSSGYANTTFNAHGAGWPTNEYVRSYWQFGNATGEGYPRDDGSFDFSIWVPNYVSAGTYQICFDAIDGWTGQHTTVTKTFQILAAANHQVLRIVALQPTRAGGNAPCGF